MASETCKSSNGDEDESSLNLKDHIWTCPADPRFPNQNASGWCFNMFVDYQRCSRLLGKKFEGCDFFKKCYQSLCPNAWIERWYQQIADGTFPLDLPEDKESREGIVEEDTCK